MQYVWKLKKCFLKDIIEQFPEPKPAHTTVSTVIKNLVNKNYLGFKAYSKIREYYPEVSKNEYFKKRFKGVLSNFFNGSAVSFASSFAEDENININELEEIKKIVENQINKRKTEVNE